MLSVYHSPAAQRWRVWVGDRYLPGDHATADDAMAAGMTWIDGEHGEKVG